MTQQNKPSNCKSKCNKSHLTLAKRMQLLECLKQGLNQKETAAMLNVSKTTVSRELFAHRKLAINRRKQTNRCIHLKDCSVKHVCQNMKCISKCKNCQYGHNCNLVCPQYEGSQCKRVSRFPYVCNGCPKAQSCVLDFY